MEGGLRGRDGGESSGGVGGRDRGGAGDVLRDGARGRADVFPDAGLIEVGGGRGARVSARVVKRRGLGEARTELEGASLGDGIVHAATTGGGGGASVLRIVLCGKARGSAPRGGVTAVEGGCRAMLKGLILRANAWEELGTALLDDDG